MIIQWLLTAAFLVILVYSYRQRAHTRLVSEGMMAVSLIGICLVLYPDAANIIANEMGVGRGVDLLFYVFIVISLTAIFVLHLRMRATHVALTELARQIALSKPIKGQHDAAQTDR